MTWNSRTSKAPRVRSRGRGVAARHQQPGTLHRPARNPSPPQHPRRLETSAKPPLALLRADLEQASSLESP